MPSSMLRMLAALSALALLLVACGQHPGVYVEGDPMASDGDDGMNGGGGLSVGDGGGDLDGGSGDLDANGGGEVADPSGDGSQQASSPEGGNGGGGDGSGDGNGGAQAQGQLEPQGSDRTGVSDDTIRLATHAPVTGAAPLPSESFEQTSDMYWRWLFEEQGESVLGRTNIEQEFADDRYDPSSARQICGELADRAFIVAGGGGTDQIQACGQLAGRDQFPYFSPGVTEHGLEGNPWYFAHSMTYRQQGILLAEYVRSNFGDAPVGAIVTQTPNFDDAVAGWEQGISEQGLDDRGTLRHPRGQQGWYDQMASEMNDRGVEVLYILTSPLDFIRFAQVSQRQGYDFQYVGVGISMGLNAVLGSSCDDNEADGAIFFSPFPALETADDIDPEFNQAAQTFGLDVDDIAWAIWGASKNLHVMFERYGETFGNDLTREDFRALIEGTDQFEGGVYPPINYSSDNHFGGQGVHVLEADCSIEEYRDAGTFQSGF